MNRSPDFYPALAFTLAYLVCLIAVAVWLISTRAKSQPGGETSTEK